jgi:hypothetical protein
MKTLKEKLVERLLNGSDDLFSEFVIVGLQSDLDLIRDEINLLLTKKKLEEFQFEDFKELYQDCKAIVRILAYHGYKDYEDQVLLDKAWEKILEKLD